MSNVADDQSSLRHRPLHAVELSLGRLRLLGAVLIAGATAFDLLDHWGTTSTLEAVRTGLAVTMIVLALLVSYRLSTGILQSGRPGRIVRAQLGLDVMATVATVIVLHPEPGGVLWVVVGLPVLEGALRFRLLGAFATWLAVAFLLSASAVIRWQPGEGLAPFEEMASPLTLALALGIPAGYLAERLTAELLEASQARDDAHDRAWLLAVLTVAGNDLASPDLDFEGLVSTMLDAGAEFGFRSVDCIVIDGAGNWRVLGERRDDEPPPAPIAIEQGEAIGSLGEVQLAEDRAVVLLARSDRELLVLRAFSDVGRERPERIAALRTLAGSVVTAHTAMAQRRELAVERARLAYEATHDALTGLLNRSGLLDVLDEVRQRPTAASLLFADLDGFKAVNDTHGHDAGDEVLRVVAERLRVQVPEGSVVARLGGDEFVLVVPASVDRDTLVERLERIVAEPVTTADAQVCVGVSIGSVPLDASPEDVLRRADRAMYQVKSRRHEASRPLSPLD